MRVLLFPSKGRESKYLSENIVKPFVLKLDVWIGRMEMLEAVSTHIPRSPYSKCGHG